jgi:agmatine deiminase
MLIKKLLKYTMTLKLKHSTPSSQGFFMPAEWEQHLSTWLAWPHNLGTWKSKDLQQVENLYIKIIRNLVTGERINILIENKFFQKRITSLLNSNGLNNKQIYFHKILTDDAWIRDFGPNFIVRESSSGRQAAINRWQFNSWGEKYPWQKDNEVSDKIIRESKINWFDPKIVLEGGAFDVNGKGVCLTTSTCLLNANRNGGLSIKEMEKFLKSYLGIEKIIWLEGTLKGDDTDGHVDNLARFVNHTTIVYITEKDENDENYLSLKRIEEILKKARGPNGKPFLLIPLPMPRKITDNNFHLPASYANFYIGNNAVLLPAFNDPNDKVAQSILKTCFPQKNIVPIDSQVLIKGQGGIHCITQQQPMHRE